MSVRDAMATNVISTRPGEDVEVALRLMSERRICHLPVIKDERPQGIVSLGDLLRFLRYAADLKRGLLSDYVSGKYLHT